MASSKAKPNGKRTRGSQRTTQEDWIDAALDTLISEGVDAVKISLLAARLNCARSSFYWYFKDRGQLLDMLLDQWQRQNTQAIIDQASKPADSINFALSNLFSCWISATPAKARLFDTRLDFAVRDWARRDAAVRRAVDISDDARISAIKGMFERFDYDAAEAGIRARIVYFTQIGYEALDVRETNLERAKNGRDYLYCLTGRPPTEAEVRATVHLTGHRLEDL
ncbi:TetR/AcrR family transcriptional regulator [Rhodalgimonas zhirmunskyi]|uniref:TetR/AcrR family transcriptional regulator n=1 Tax=Rhodalgimonas zhirmunskyi TaxID=2964767 RepID=A0AAJ1UGL8_9RHOB|nr:TetR/AcrR family transcriptional regulator [Rhodoalgimonas zhirmunskyi]MDQ2095537.1 TetR/AcrR family transcriptional regulator [Rhodoalgimonas zhirmunskyi]